MGTHAVLDPVGVCNLALIQLKQKSITSIETPVSDAEVICSTAYDQTRLAVLRSHSWNFAKKRAVLSKDSQAPPFGYSARFLLPSDFVRYLSRHDADAPRALVRDQEYQIENGYLLLNSDGPINIRYIFDQTDIAAWDSIAVHVLSLSLAVVLAPNFSAREGRVNAIKQQLLETKAEALAVDGQERPPVRFELSRWIRQRRGGHVRSNTAGPFMYFEN